jgi:hypothetical protein
VSADIAYTDLPDRSQLDRAAAEDLTRRIRVAADEVWSLLCEAHELRAWEVLGYETWEGYVRGEFDMSRSRSYQLLDQGRIVREIEAAASTDVDISEADARDIKSDLAEVVDEVRDATAGLPPEKRKAAAREVVKAKRKEPKSRPPTRHKEPADQDTSPPAVVVEMFARCKEPAEVVSQFARLVLVVGWGTLTGLLDLPDTTYRIVAASSHRDRIIEALELVQTDAASIVERLESCAEEPA